MRHGFKVLLTAVVPLMALVTTSCGNKSISFDDALKYAAEHFDDNSLDTVPVDYTFNVNKFGADLNVNIIDSLGISSDVQIAFGLDNITTILRGDYYAYCISSALLTQVQNNYSTVSSLVMESFTKIPVDIIYETSNGGMRIVATTNGVTNNLVDLVKLAVSLLTSLSYLPVGAREAIIDKLFGDDDDDSKELEPIKPVFNNGTYISLEKALGKTKQSEKKFDMAVVVKFITELMAAGLSIGVDPTSSSTNDDFECYVASDSHGYINSGKLNLSGDIKISLVVATTAELISEHPYLSGIDGRYTISGNIGFDFSASAEFTNK